MASKSKYVMTVMDGCVTEVNSKPIFDGSYSKQGEYLVTTGLSQSLSKAFFNVNYIRLENPKHIHLSTDISKVGDQAFWKFLELESITFSKSVESIGKESFSGCKNLQVLVIANPLIAIDDSAFSKCPNLNKIVIQVSNSEHEDAEKLQKHLKQQLKVQVEIEFPGLSIKKSG